MASTPYCEQVGVKRQDPGNSGEISHWYSLISNKNNCPINHLIPLTINSLYIRLEA